MAVKDLQKKLDATAKPPAPRDVIERQYRKTNAAWLQKSAHIALTILAALDQKGWSQKQLAEALRVSPQQVNKIVRGKENLTLQTIASIEHALTIKLLHIEPFNHDFMRFQDADFEEVEFFEVDMSKAEQLTYQTIAAHEADAPPKFTPRAKSQMGVAA